MNISADATYSSGKIAIVAARFNEQVVEEFLANTTLALKQAGVDDNNLDIVRVPGTFELPVVVKRLAKTKKYAGIIALGVVIKGETAHFEYICDGATNALAQLALQQDLPIAYGILTTYNQQQAQARSSAEAKNKGKEVAMALLETINVMAKIQNEQ